MFTALSAGAAPGSPVCVGRRGRATRRLGSCSPRRVASRPRSGADPSPGSARRLAYADPPYPGKARLYYREHPDYGGEVDHVELLSRLATYDGWALSTSAAALPSVLALAVAQGLAPHRSPRGCVAPGRTQQLATP